MKRFLKKFAISVGAFAIWIGLLAIPLLLVVHFDSGWWGLLYFLIVPLESVVDILNSERTGKSIQIRWVSVKEGVPFEKDKQGVPVLVTYLDDDGDPHSDAVAVYAGHRWNDRGEIEHEWNAGDGKPFGAEVTHWAKIPTAIKTKRGINWTWSRRNS